MKIASAPSIAFALSVVVLKFLFPNYFKELAFRLVMVMSEGLQTFARTKPSTSDMPMFPPPMMAAFI
jgi:hypothetical protein